jgi:hypothetical protein
MKRALIAAGALILGGMPAMAGGLEGGVKNSYFTNFSTETINFGTRDIHVDSYSEVSWQGETESHKSFVDFMGKVTGVEGTYGVHNSSEESSYKEGSFNLSKDGYQKPGKGKGHGYGRKGGYEADLHLAGGQESSSSSVENLDVAFEDPKVQMTWSEGWTNTWMTAEGYDETQTNVNIYEEYEGYSENLEHGHEATSFASTF